MKALTELAESQQLLLAQHDVCYRELCPPRQLLTPIYYTITIPQEFGFGIPYRINFDHRISDTVPPAVLTGPLWGAFLREGVYNVELEVHIQDSAWCAGKKVTLSLVACDQVIVIESETMVAGTSPVTLSGTTTLILTQPCKVFATVMTDDPTAPVRVIDSGFVRITVGA